MYILRLWTLDPRLFDEVGLRAWWGNCCLAFNCIVNGQQNQYSLVNDVARFTGNVDAFVDYMRGVHSQLRYVYNVTIRNRQLFSVDSRTDYEKIPTSETRALYEYSLLQSRLYWRNRKQFCYNLGRARCGFSILNGAFHCNEVGGPEDIPYAKTDMMPPNRWTKRVRLIEN